MEHIDIRHILEKMQPEARKTPEQTGKIINHLRKKMKRNGEFSYLAHFRMSFWKVCFKQAEIHVEAVE